MIFKDINGNNIFCIFLQYFKIIYYTARLSTANYIYGYSVNIKLT